MIEEIRSSAPALEINTKRALQEKDIRNKEAAAERH